MLPNDYTSFAEKVYNWLMNWLNFLESLTSEKASIWICNWLFGVPFYIKGVLQLFVFYLNT